MVSRPDRLIADEMAVLDGGILSPSCLDEVAALSSFVSRSLTTSEHKFTAHTHRKLMARQQRSAFDQIRQIRAICWNKGLACGRRRAISYAKQGCAGNSCSFAYPSRRSTAAVSRQHQPRYTLQLSLLDSATCVPLENTARGCRRCDGCLFAQILQD